VITWTKEEIQEFDRLVEMTSSRHQLTRITGRMDMATFIIKHGKEKCDAMWEHLENGGAMIAKEASTDE